MKNKTAKGIIFFLLTAISFVFIVLSMIMSIATENTMSIRRRQLASLERETRILEGKLSKKMLDMNVEMSYSNIVARAREIGLRLPPKQLTIVKVDDINRQMPRETLNIITLLSKLRINQSAKASDDVR